MAIPLAPTKVIPMTNPSTSTIIPTASAKRPYQSSSVETSRKRPKSRLTTPEFKVPLLPHRALTPSSSTVAASSSPIRHIASSSPSNQADMEEVTITPGESLVFGRHRHTPINASVSSSVLLKSTVPVHLHHLVTDIDSPTSIVYLARTASHASRTHALVEWQEEGEMVKVLVIGQNGMKINGKRVLAGQRVKLDRQAENAKGRERVVLDFYGTKMAVRFPTSQGKESKEEIVTFDRADLSALFTPDRSSPPLSPSLSLPPSSPPLAPLTPSEDVDMEDEAKPTSSERASSPVFSTRGSSPLSAPGSDDEEEPREPEDVQEKIVKQELVEAHVAGPSTSVQVDNDPCPAEVDLPALLATTVVFSGSSKLSLPDLVKHMLDSQSSLKDLGSESRWEKWANEVLEHNPMFGKVLRHGKDSSGHPLLPHYFYNPANDPDTSRAEELGGLVRPLRTVQRAGGKAIDWRPVGSGRRRY